MTPKLKEKLKELPREPGVYFHKNRAGEVIYVGKAAILKNRVRQYFQSPDRKDAKTRALVAEIDDTDWIVVDTEMDALFLESEMIKRYMPKWNILLRDDKAVSYIRIDMKSEVPCVMMTRNPEDDGAEYYGPYYGKTTIMRALRVLRKIFPYYDRPYTGRKTLNTDLGLTPGVEVGKMSAQDYKRNLRHMISYLKGNRKRLVRDIEKMMYEAAANGEYEKAAEYRNQFFGLKGLGTKIIFSDKEFLDISSDKALQELQEIIGAEKPLVRIEGYDISHQSGTNAVGSMVCFINGASDRTKYRRFKLRKQQNNDPESMFEVLSRRIHHLDDWGRPDLIVLDGSVGQLLAVRAVCAEAGVPVIGRDKSGDHSKNARVRIVLPEGSDSYRMVELAPDSHIAKLIARIDDESHRFAIQYHTLLKRKDALK
ncbi:MAG: UvrB/UvrC motif-containing protein [Candidatus Saccharibacteria bacterium]|nr:UvrB/UvrC motif-containing protein [Candidatus Saccharibacteria bacterium]